MTVWHFLVEILILLAAALLMGTLAEQLRQSAVLGYLLAGALVGPNIMGWVETAENVEAIAELGVALLLLSIGLEFRFEQLLRMGPIALIGGTLQVTLTTAFVAVIALLLGLGATAAVILGAIVALSSTACVLRLLIDRQQIDSVFGRSAMGILLLQDLAVLPLTVIVAALSAGGDAAQIAIAVGKTGLFTVAMIGGFYVVFNLIVPRVLNMRMLTRNRELPILLAVVVAIGSASAAHEIGISPAIGAFIAGLMLAGSPFATQVRSDVSSLRTVLVTLFFASVGMYADPVFIMNNAHWLAVVVAIVVLGKTLITGGIARGLGVPVGGALATGLCLAQIGEFSFVLAKIASAEGGPIEPFVFNLIVAATIVTLMLTPFFVRAAPTITDVLTRKTDRGTSGPREEEDLSSEDINHVLLVGFGPAAQQVASAIMSKLDNRSLEVLDLNPRNVAIAEQFGLKCHVGDASQADVLEHAGVHRLDALVITIPDANAARRIIELARALNPNLHILVRARYHVTRWELAMAGATIVIDEEEQVGNKLAEEAIAFLKPE